jgi:Fur family ferric uptake transcriptional regulator
MEEDIITTVRDIFAQYLNMKGYRKTLERYAILDEIYSNANNFTIETLYNSMKNQNYSVCKATIYNTINLLMDCDLVIKHQFEKNITKYERALSMQIDNHLVCTKCGNISEFCDPMVSAVINNTAEKINFEPFYHSLYIYGVCFECGKTRI